MSKVPTEKQLEAAFEVLAWLVSRRPGTGTAVAVQDVREAIKQEVDRCLDE